MKKIISWFTKKSKIVRIVRYIYRGSYVMYAILVSARQSLVQVQPTEEQKGKFAKVIEHLDTCISYINDVNTALEKILEWVGPDELAANNTAVVDVLSQAAVATDAAAAVEGGESTRGHALATTTFALNEVSVKLLNEIDA